MLWAGLSTLSGPLQGSWMYLSWEAVSNSFEESSFCWVVLVWDYFIFTMILWIICGQILASETACLHQGKEILTACVLILYSDWQCAIDFPCCWCVGECICGLSLASLRYEFVVICLLGFCGVLFGFFFCFFSRRRFKCGLFPFGFVNPLEEFLYGPTCVEEIMLSKAVTGCQGKFKLGIRNKLFTESD